MVTAVSNGAVVYRRDAVHHQQQQLLSPYTASTQLIDHIVSFHLNLAASFTSSKICFNDAVVETPRRLYR